MTGSATMCSLTYLADREKIREFARAVGETDPLHLDVAAARRAGHADLVAPPMFVSVYAGPVFREALWSPALAVDRRLTVHGSQAFRWERLVIAGDELTTTATVSSSDAKGANRFIVIQTRSVDETSALVVLGTWTVIVRPPPDRGATAAP